VEAAIAWLVTLICRDGERWGWATAKDIVFGSPLERGVTRATSCAMSAAVATTLGPAASPEAIGRMEAVLDEIWPSVTPFESDPTLLRASGFARPLIERIESFVETALRVAGTPVLNLQTGYEPTSSLASLAFELETSIDETVFVRAFTSAWLAEVRAAALTEPAMVPLASQIEHETTRALVKAVEASVGRQIDCAVQVLSETMASRAGTERSWPERWFEFHIVPIDRTILHESSVALGVRPRQPAPTLAESGRWATGPWLQT